MEKDTKIFVDGIWFENPTEKQQSFILGKMSVNKAKFIAFMEQYVNGAGYINIDILKGKEGKIYLQLNTFKMERPASLSPADQVAADSIPF